MAVAEMSLVNIGGRIESLDRVIRACTESGVFQPDDPLSFFSDPSGFTHLQESDPYTDLRSRLSAFIKQMSGFDPKADVHVPADDFDLKRASAYFDTLQAQTDELLQKRSALAEQQEELATSKELFEHFIGLNIDLKSIRHCETFHVRFGRLPVQSYEKLGAFDDNPFVLFFPGAKDEAYYWGTYFAPTGMLDRVDRIFSGLYFERLHIPDADGTPQEIVADIDRRLADIEAQQNDLNAAITELWKKERFSCMTLFNQLSVCEKYFGFRRHAIAYRDDFVMTGWIPKSEEAAFCRALDTVDDIEYTVNPPDADTHHTPPTKLKNNPLFRPYEFYVEMYGLPGYHEPDPTAYVAVTYTLMFGAMFGDVGQGLLLALVGWLMWKLKKMAIGKILLPCGISAAAFGCVYGSVFGFEHVLDPLYGWLFGWDSKPIDVMKSQTAIMIILASVALGCTLIVISMGLNIFAGFRRRDYQEAVFGQNGIAGLVFFLGIVVGAALTLLLNIPVFSLPYILLTIVLPLLLIFLKEPLGHLVKREFHKLPEKWGEFFAQSFFELFEVLLSYMSNVMSFMRVGAFVLIHAGMMMAVMTLALMVPNPIAYWAIIVFGNALVMAMEALLVAIQVLRLEYYEMFSRYYIGDGRPFEPMTLSDSAKA